MAIYSHPHFVLHQRTKADIESPNVISPPYKPTLWILTLENLVGSNLVVHEIAKGTLLLRVFLLADQHIFHLVGVS